MPFFSGTGYNYTFLGTTTGVLLAGNQYAWTGNPPYYMDSGTSAKSTFTVITATSWASLALGQSHTIGVKTDGTLWGWGNNNYGQITDSAVSFASVNAGYSVLNSAIDVNGKLYVWGNNTLYTKPTLNGPSSWLYTARGHYASATLAAIKSDYSLWSTEFTGTTEGMLKKESTNNSWTQVFSQDGSGASFAIRLDGTLWAWGLNTYGALGDGTTVTRAVPTQIQGSWILITAGANLTASVYGIRTDGTLWAWGYNQYGTLGDNSVIAKSSPVQIPGSWTNITSTGLTAYAIRTDNTLWSWGYNLFGELGAGIGGGVTHRSSPVQVLTNRTWSLIKGAYGIDTTGALWAFGGDNSGGTLLGDGGAVTAYSSSVQVGAAYTWSDISMNTWYYFQRSDGTFYGMGLNNNRQLGDGTSINRSFLTALPIGSGWTQVMHDYYAGYGVKNDGSLWTWGTNTTSGSLGTGDTVMRSSPTQIARSIDYIYSMPMQIGSDNNWASVYAGALVSYGIKQNGTLWGWGANDAGALGINDTIHRSSPVQMGTSSWLMISNKWTHVLALKADRTLWSWGDNTYGQLGYSGAYYRSSPIQVGTSSWASVSAGGYFSSALKQDGSLFTWGYNALGALGLGNLIHRSSPVQLGTSSWTMVSAGQSSIHGLTTAGGWWAWGQGIYGNIGSTVNRSVPGAVHATSLFTTVSAGSYSAYAKSTGGVWFAIGLNTSGQLGTNDVFSRSSPTQITTGSTLTQIIAGLQNAAGKI